MIEKLQGQELLPDSDAEPIATEPESAEPSRLAGVGGAAGVEDGAPGASRVSPVEAAPDAALSGIAATSELATPAGESETGAADDSIVPLERGELRGAVEAVLFSVSEPLTIRALADLLKVTVHEAREVVEELRLEYIDSQRAFRIEDIAGGVQILTVSRFDPWIRRLRDKERESRLTAASLESLAVIAYKQPISRADLEAIRGVGCGPTLKTLLERGLIQIAGRSEGLGKPLLYGTTRRFLESFGISSVRELPQPELLERPVEKPAAPRPLAEPDRPLPLEAPATEAIPQIEAAKDDEPSITEASGPLS